MTLKQLKSFLAVAQTLSFAEASQKMFITQPALSLAIKSLEESIGGPLIVRTTRTVSLTPEGKVLYKKGKRLIDEWAAMEEEMHQLFTLQKGLVSVAAMPSFSANVLPNVILKFRSNHPNLNVKIHDIIAEETVDFVRTGKVELGVTFKPQGLSEQDAFTELYIDKFVAVLPQSHFKSDQKSIYWNEIIEEDFVALQRPSMVRLIIEETLNQYNKQLNVTFDSHQLATVGRMVAAGLGISVVPSLCADQMVESGAKVLPINGPEIQSPLGILTRRKHRLSLPAQAMFDALVDFYNT